MFTMPSLEKILLVEDDFVDAKIFKRAIKSISSDKYKVEHKENGREALIFIKNSQKIDRPDLIFLDINMPIMSGLEFLQEIKADEELKKIPVVMLTTSDDHKDKQICFGLSAAGYFVKKSDYEEFELMLKTISSYWDKNELLRQAKMKFTSFSKI